MGLDVYGPAVEQNGDLAPLLRPWAEIWPVRSCNPVCRCSSVDENGAGRDPVLQNVARARRRLVPGRPIGMPNAAFARRRHMPWWNMGWPRVVTGMRRGIDGAARYGRCERNGSELAQETRLLDESGHRSSALR
ncbi:MAG: hypothetical protein BroJett029_39800 [Alphaproteobacteria bacterium]|nr:MAG: hypothetical protein BroJett029_39800 [Alphaproteobacteria bacterium]